MQQKKPLLRLQPTSTIFALHHTRSTEDSPTRPEYLRPGLPYWLFWIQNPEIWLFWEALWSKIIVWPFGCFLALLQSFPFHDFYIEKTCEWRAHLVPAIIKREARHHAVALWMAWAAHGTLNWRLTAGFHGPVRPSTFVFSWVAPGPDLPIGYIGLSLGPQDPRVPPANCGRPTHRVNCRCVVSSINIPQNFTFYLNSSWNLVLFTYSLIFRIDNSRVFQRVYMNLNMTVVKSHADYCIDARW